MREGIVHKAKSTIIRKLSVKVRESITHGSTRKSRCINSSLVFYTIMQHMCRQYVYYV